MAYQVIDPIALSPKSASAANYAVTLADFGLSLVNDDYLLLSVACSATSGTLSVSGAGWSELSELDVSLGPRMAHYICKVAAGTAADPTITLSAGTGLWQVSLEQWRDVDITTGTITTDFAETPVTIDPGASVTSVTTTSSTPSADNCTIHYFGVTRNGSTTVSCRFLSDKVVGWGMQNVDDNAVFMSYGVGTVQQQTKANSQQVMYAGASCRAGVIVLYIKNKSGGKMERDCRAAMTKVGWFGDYGVAHESGAALAAAVGAPSTFCVWNAGTEQINGIDAATTAATMTNDIAGLAPASSKWSQFNSTENTAGKWVGGWWATPSTIDMTGKIFSIEWHIPLIGVQVGAEGVLIAFGDSATADAGNAVVFQLASKNKIAGALSYTSHIAVETAEQYAAVGSIDWASIDKIGIFYHRAGSSATARQIVFRNMFLHGSSVMVGGNSARPLDIRFLDAALNGWGYSGLCTKSGDAVLVKTSCQFGDGTIATYVDTTATLLNTPSAYSPITQPLWNVPANGITVGMKGASGDTMRFVASAMAAGAGAEQNFTIDSATSASATVSFSGEVISNFLFTGDTDAPISGATYSGCDEVAFGGADVTNVTITDTTSTDAACSFDANGVVVTSSTIDGTGALYAIELGTAVTAITLASCTITAGSTDKIHVLKTLTNVAAGAFVAGVHYRINTVGTTDFTAIGASANTIGVNFTATGAGTGTGTADQAVKITISGTTSLAEADATTAGAPVWVAAPALYQVVVVSGFTAGSRIQIYDETSNTELFNGTASAGNTVVSGTTATWTDPLSASATRAIRVRVAYVNGTSAKAFVESTGLTCGITEGTESITYPITQVADTTYDANGINGPTIYAGSGVTFTDAATDLVNINVGVAGTVSLQTVYACFVYWMFTAAGIDDDVAYIDAPDPANYILTSMKFRNTSATPLKITGGYFYDSTGSVENCVDYAGSTGNIYPMPAHVVAYATGSGALTAGDITNIWSAATRTITTTIPTASDVATQVLTSAQSAPIYADVRKVIGDTITGSGSEADPWGP